MTETHEEQLAFRRKVLRALCSAGVSFCDLEWQRRLLTKCAELTADQARHAMGMSESQWTDAERHTAKWVEAALVGLQLTSKERKILALLLAEESL